MPVTPLHIGIPGLISFYYPKRVDILSAVIGSVIIDLDFILFLLIGTPIHGYLHTFLGATIISIFIIIILKLSQKQTIKIKKWFKWEGKSNLKSISIGAFIGTYSHIILDSLIYNEINPFYPIEGNPLYLENGQDVIFVTIYVIALITTIMLIALYSWKYIKNNYK